MLDTIRKYGGKILFPVSFIFTVSLSSLTGTNQKMSYLTAICRPALIRGRQKFAVLDLSGLTGLQGEGRGGGGGGALSINLLLLLCMHVLDSMFAFHRLDRSSNPGRGGEIFMPLKTICHGVIQAM